MKYFELKSIAQFFSNFSHIKHIKRVDNNLLKIEFSRDENYYFDMTKGNATIYTKEEIENSKKDFRSPFDITLQKKLTNAKVNKVYLYNDDKILNFELFAKSKYKQEIVTVSFEFTGKNTNVIIFDDKKTIHEALRHIDEEKSSRVVKVGVRLADIPKPNFDFKIDAIKNVKSFLLDIHIKKQEKELTTLKKQKINQIKKQQQKIEKILAKLEDLETLENKSKEFASKGNLLLTHLHTIKPYQKEIELTNFDGEVELITLDTNYPTPSTYVDFLFNQSKKLKQKIKNQYIEEANLEQKLEFLQRLEQRINEATNTSVIEFYMPKRDKNQTKTKKEELYQSFFIDGYKIMLGRHERENIYLLENSKASDFWFHLQGVASSHVIVSNTKKELPEHILYEAASICAKFSTNSHGVFYVDYTQRRNVKIQTRANVLYNPYKTVTVKI
jgi:predicted ribosome quality control (RQC) complex YloA/Tae2 family protein